MNNSDRETVYTLVQLVHGYEVANLLRQMYDQNEALRIAQASLSKEFISEKLLIQKSVKKGRRKEVRGCTLKENPQRLLKK